MTVPSGTGGVLLARSANDPVGFGAFPTVRQPLSVHAFEALSSSLYAAPSDRRHPCPLVFPRVAARDLGNGLVSASNIEFVEQHRSS
jgi:hypothetical protein